MGSTTKASFPGTNANQSEAHADMGDEVKRGRGRPKISANDTLILSRRVTREIDKLSRETRITRQQILEDICDNGLVAVRGMYVGLIETRKAILQELDEKNTSKGSNGHTETSEPAPKYHRESEIQTVPSSLHELSGTQVFDEQFDPAFEPVRLGEAPDTDTGEDSLKV